MWNYERGAQPACNPPPPSCHQTNTAKCLRVSMVTTLACPTMGGLYFAVHEGQLRGWEQILLKPTCQFQLSASTEEALFAPVAGEKHSTSPVAL